MAFCLVSLIAFFSEKLQNAHYHKHADKNGNVMMSERNYGTMSRSYQLPNVDDSNIKASYKDGVLNITLPKLTESKESGHNIDIQ